MTKSYNGVIDHYRNLLDIPNEMPSITLLEGNTPLIPVPSISNALGGSFGLWIKFEGLNPTGSFKDRGMTVAMSEAVHRGAKISICASTGNTAASAAAYSARAGIRSIVIIPAGKVAAGKLAGAIAYGADVVQIDGSFDLALDLVVRLADKHPIAMVNSLNPFRLEGQKQQLLRFAMIWEMLLIGWHYPSETQEISLLIGRASDNIILKRIPDSRKFLGFKPRVPLHWFSDRLSRIRRQSQLPFASAAGAWGRSSVSRKRISREDYCCI